MSDRAPICPFCNAPLPAADIDRDATPARGVSPARTAPPPSPVPATPPPAMSTPASPEPSGTTQLGPFDRVRPLDASGRTWLSFTPDGGGRAVVVKALDDADAKAAALWSALPPHPSLVRAAGVLVGDEKPRVVYEYVAPDAHSRKVLGRSAFERRLRRDRLAFPDVLRLAVLVCRGLEHAYAGGLVGHGNLKASNLLLGLDGGLRVSEPGLAGVESPLELAPERFGGAPADERSDVYSLGVLVFQMASGRAPFDAPSSGAADGPVRYREALRHFHLDALVPRLDSPLASVLERCLQKAPAARFPAVAALRTELEDLLRRETGLLPAVPAVSEAAGWARAQQALALLAVGRAEPAVRAFDEALSVLPPTASVRAVRATALNVIGQHEEAVLGAEQAIAIDPQYAPAWRQKGESLAALGRREEALDALEQTTVIAPRDAASLVALGRLLGTVGRLPQALSAYDRAVAADAEHVDVWLERGITLASAGLRADAAGAFLRFLDVSPAGHPARRRAEELLREVRGGAAPQAAPPPSVRDEPVPPLAPPEVVEAAAPEPVPTPAPEPPARGHAAAEPEPPPLPIPPEPEPTDIAGFNDRGVALFREGRLDLALVAFDRALALDQRRAATWSNRANVLFRLGRSEEGLADQEKALAREPRSPRGWLTKATIERSLGRTAEARRSLLDLLSVHPAPDQRVMDQARSLFADLERDGAPPGPATALGFLLAGVQHAEAGRLEKAVADFDEALGRNAFLATGWLFKGDALLGLGRGAEAAHAYDEGLAADPGDTRLLLGLGRARARLGQLDIAAAVLTHALDLADAETRPMVERLL
ncbi:MAG TPA: tetratricopeptide repeat protein, partial [Vicinamibacteria bacterium]|nr:tetratricopeptide repeat protein [Vicinamibacteria bacterium]